MDKLIKATGGHVDGRICITFPGNMQFYTGNIHAGQVCIAVRSGRKSRNKKFF